MKITLLTLLLFSLVLVLARSLDCDQYFNSDILEIIGVPEEQACLLDVDSLLVKHTSSEIDEATKTFVEFVVDTSGVSRCIHVVKSGIGTYYSLATNLVRETRFSPAKHRGRNSNSIMILPVTFVPNKE